jgi:hypothetical protein
MFIDRTDPEHVALWRRRHRQIFSDYAGGLLSLSDAQQWLEQLGFKREALAIELLELERSKRTSKGADRLHIVD